MYKMVDKTSKPSIQKMIIIILKCKKEINCIRMRQKTKKMEGIRIIFL